MLSGSEHCAIVSVKNSTGRFVKQAQGKWYDYGCEKDEVGKHKVVDMVVR